MVSAMKKNVIKLLPLALFSTVAYASNYQDKEIIPDVEPATLTYKFLATDYDGQTVDAFTIMANISNTILNSTAYPTIAKKAPCSGWSSEEKCAIRTGTYITIGKNQLIVAYHNVKNEDGAIKNSLSESDIYNNLSFNIAVATHNEESYIIATLTIPNQVDINASNMSLTRYKPLDTPINLRNNLLGIIEPSKISLTKYHLETGSVDNQYSTDSVYGNLGRLLGKYDWAKFPHCDAVEKIMSRASDSKDINTLDLKVCKVESGKLTEAQQKTQDEFLDRWDISDEQSPTTYRYKINNVVIPVNVVAFPYRTQSKATFKAIVPYIMTSDGKISIDKTAMLSMSKSIESSINN